MGIESAVHDRTSKHAGVDADGSLASARNMPRKGMSGC